MFLDKVVTLLAVSTTSVVFLRREWIFHNTFSLPPSRKPYHYSEKKCTNYTESFTLYLAVPVIDLIQKMNHNRQSSSKLPFKFPRSATRTL